MGTITNIHWDTPPFHWDNPYGRVLASSAVPFSTTSIATQDTLAKTITIPAGVIEVGDILVFTTFFTCTDNANIKWIHLDINDSSQRFATYTLTNQSSGRLQHSIGWEDSTTAHWYDNVDPDGWGLDSTAVQSGTVDLSNDVDIEIRHQFISSGDTITTKHYILELIKNNPET